MSAQPTDLLRVVTAGSVDDGKSTLVGRLLYDTKSILADQLDAVHRASADRGQDTPDLSLLVDGLRAEREQGITIDVAYRYFATPARSFVLADTPGHVQYTRNTVTGASTAQLALLLVDARTGVVDQTRRHAAVVALLGVPKLVLAVNKIDLVDYDEPTYRRIRDEFMAHAVTLGYAEEDMQAIPVSALHGDNVVERSAHTPWHDGPTLLHHLETVPTDAGPANGPARFPVQYVIRPQAEDHRCYAGQLAGGPLSVGDAVMVWPTGLRTTVDGMETPNGPATETAAGQAITVRLTDDLDVGRGDVITPTDHQPTITDTIEATVCWLAESTLHPGARLLVKHGTRTVQAMVEDIHTRLDEQQLTRDDEAEELGLNDIGRVTVRTAEPLPVDDYPDNRTTGAFLMIDPADGTTLAAGLIGTALPTV